MIRLFFFCLVLSPSSFAGVSVSPATINTGSASWWSGFTAVSNATGAQVSKGVTASLLSSLGASNSLSATISTTVPRATLASSAAKILRGASPGGLASMALFAAVSAAISMNDDGTVTTTGTPTTTYSDATSTGTCWLTGGSSLGVMSVGSCFAAIQTYNTYVSSWCSYDGTRMATKSATGGCALSNGFMDKSSLQCTAPAVPDYSRGQCATTVTPTTTATPTQSELQTAIQNSTTPSHDLFVAQMNDILSHKAGNIDFGAEVMPKTQAATVSASPVTGPAEVVAIETTPNPDGSTTTTTRTEQTTATPSPRGSTVGDIGVDWQTTTTTTKTAHNNTTGTDAVTTTTENAGTSTTQQPQQQSDLCQLHPEIAACASLGSNPSDSAPSVTSQPLNVNLSLPSSVAGSCPADYTRTLTGGKVLAWSWQPACDFASGIRPVVLAMAFLAAAFIVSGSVRVDA